MIWFGCSANCSANSASVLSTFKAAVATLARNSGENVLLGRLIVGAPWRFAPPWTATYYQLSTCLKRLVQLFNKMVELMDQRAALTIRRLTEGEPVTQVDDEEA